MTRDSVKEAVSSTGAQKSGPGGKLVRLAEIYGLPLLFILLILLFVVNPQTGENFTSAPNIRQLLLNQAVTGIIAIAMVVPLAAGYFDLSVAAITGVSSVTFALLVGPVGLNAWVAGVLAILASLVAGAVNGVLVAVLKLNGFIVTLGTFLLFQGLLLWLTGGRTISQGIPIDLGRWTSSEFLWLPGAFWVLILVALIVWFFLMKVPAGRELESIGSNESAARLVGIPVRRRVFVAFLSSAFLASLAGLILTMRAGSADAAAGPGYLFPALAAVFLGATCIRPGRYNVWGAVIGVYFLAVAVNGFTLLGADSWITQAFNGAALVIAVMISTLVGRQNSGKSV